MLFIEQLRSMMDIAAAYLLVRYLQKSYSDSLDDEMNLCFFCSNFPSDATEDEKNNGSGNGSRCERREVSWLSLFLYFRTKLSGIE